MKYNRLPSKMWLVFNHSFRKELTNTFGYSKRDAIIIAKKAKEKYKEIISYIPEFEKKDRFESNLGELAGILGNSITEMKALKKSKIVFF